MRSVAVIMPSFGESGAISLLLPAIRDSLLTAEYSPTFLIVNDTGKDDPALQGVAHQDDTTVINAPYNMGSQEAILLGIRHALENDNVEDILTMDADGQDDPSAAPILLKAVTDSNVVVAQRIGRRPESQVFRACYATYKTVFQLLTGIRPDFGNFAAFRRGVADMIIRSPHFCITYSLALPLISKLERIPVERLPRTHSPSRMGVRGLFTHALRSTLPHLDTMAMRLTIISVIPATLGILLVVVSSFLRLFIPRLAFPNWATTIAFGVLTMSLQLLTICLILFLAASISKQVFASSAARSSKQQ